MDKLKQAIKEKGYSIGGFAQNVLGMEYKAFKYNMDNQSFKITQINAMLDKLEKKYEDIFR